MSKKINTMIGKPIETADLSQQELTDSDLTIGEWTEVGSLNFVSDSPVAWAACGVTGRGSSIYPLSMNW